MELFVLDLKIALIDFRLMPAEVGENGGLMLEGKAGADVGQRISVAGDKVDGAAVKIAKVAVGGGREMTVPEIGGLGVIEVGAGQKAEAEIERLVVEAVETVGGDKRLEKEVELIWIELEIGDNLVGLESFEKVGRVGVLGSEESVKFVPFDLVGDDEIDKVVNVRDRGSKDSQYFLVRVKVTGAATGESSDAGPAGDV